LDFVVNIELLKMSPPRWKTCRSSDMRWFFLIGSREGTIL